MILNIFVLSLMLMLVLKGLVGIDLPQNSVIELNGMTIFNCTSDQLTPSWLVSPNGNSPAATISTACGAVSDSSHYRVESSNTYECNLIVFSATMQQAGVYQCVGFSNGNQNAILTIIDPSTTIVVYNQSEIVEKDLLNISCSLTFNSSVSPAPTLLPSLHWTTSSLDQIFTSISYSPSANVITSVATVTVQRPSVPIFKCNAVTILSTSSPPPSGYATNTPTDTYQWNTVTTYNVLYPASQPVITSVSSSITVCTALNLTCFSDSNPPASYQWLNAQYGDVTNGNTIIGEYGDSYFCIATNTIRGINYSNFTAYTAPPSTDTSCKFPHSSNMAINNDTRDVGDYSCSNRSITVSLTCYVDAFPLATYEWILPNGQQPLTIETIKVSENGIYICRASLNINNEIYCANKSVNVSDCTEFQPTTTTGEITEASPPVSSEGITPNYLVATIILGLLFGLSLIVIGLLTWIVLRKLPSKTGQKKNPISTVQRNEQPEMLDVSGGQSNVAALAMYEELTPVEERQQTPVTVYEKLQKKKQPIPTKENSNKTYYNVK